MKFTAFRKTEKFRRNFAKLTEDQKRKAFEKFAVFKMNPFDKSLNTHPIKKLTAHAGQPVYSVPIENNLRVIYLIDKGVVISLDIGTHDIYK